MLYYVIRLYNYEFNQNSNSTGGPQMEGGPQAPVAKPQPAKKEITTGRNEPCPCGSGKKFKNCHGAMVES